MEKESGADFSSPSPSPARLYRGPYADIGDALARAADDFDSPATEKDAPRLPRGGLVAHPVGAGKTVIAAAHCARAKRDDDDERDEFDRDDRYDGNTLVVCPTHVAAQWLDALREFAPNLRCRRADSSDLYTGDERPDTAHAACTSESSFDPRVCDTRPVRDPKEWDVLVCSHEDVPDVSVVGVSSAVSSGGRAADDESVRRSRREHPLWDYDVPRFSVVDASEGNEGKTDKGKTDEGKKDKGKRMEKTPPTKLATPHERVFVRE